MPARESAVSTTSSDTSAPVSPIFTELMSSNTANGNGCFTENVRNHALTEAWGSVMADRPRASPQPGQLLASAAADAFQNYDYDASDSISSREEVIKLTINLVVKAQLPKCSPEDIGPILSSCRVSLLCCRVSLLCSDLCGRSIRCSMEPRDIYPVVC